MFKSQFKQSKCNTRQKTSALLLNEMLVLLLPDMERCFKRELPILQRSVQPYIQSWLSHISCTRVAASILLVGFFPGILLLGVVSAGYGQLLSFSPYTCKTCLWKHATLRRGLPRNHSDSQLVIAPWCLNSVCRSGVTRYS